MNQKELKKLLHYDKETGVFTWLVDNGPVKMGSEAGTRLDGVQVKIGINGAMYQARRLAFLYVNGKMPDDKVYHRNKIGDDNKWSNLYEKPLVCKPGITECDITGMYKDENGNYWSTLKDANEYVGTMINCNGCIDCHKCTNCHGCSDCDNCTNCTNCHGCHDCRDCIGCKGCHYSTGCTDGDGLIAA